MFLPDTINNNINSIINYKNFNFLTVKTPEVNDPLRFFFSEPKGEHEAIFYIPGSSLATINTPVFILKAWALEDLSPS